MYQVEDEPIETYHLYVVREEQKRPPILLVIISLLTLSFLVALGVLVPYQQPEERTAIRVPAVLLPLKTFTVSIPVIPTGVKSYPATKAKGILTITNGSILSQELPKGIILTGANGVQVFTDTAVFVPAGSAAGYGIAYVSAHATMSGKRGNILANDIDSVEGTSIYIRNLQAFSGGTDAYTVTFITAQDRQDALEKARGMLSEKISSRLLFQPCEEKVSMPETLEVRWMCQFVTYTVPFFPGVRVLSAHVVGKSVMLEIEYLARPQRFETK